MTDKDEFRARLSPTSIRPRPPPAPPTACRRCAKRGRETISFEMVMSRSAYERMRDSFEKLLEETGLAEDQYGRKRVIYSLRHTALMLRLLNGDNVDHLMLARNAGTSVNQLERFYLSHVEATMKVGNLQSFRAQPTPVEVGEVPIGRAKISFRCDEPAVRPQASSTGLNASDR